MELNQIIQGDSLTILPTLQDQFFSMCVTSPPYWGLRDYGIPPTKWPEVSYSPMAGIPEIKVPEWEGCLGLEATPEMYVGHLVLIFREVYRTLREDGTLWLNLGDSYTTKHKEHTQFEGSRSGIKGATRDNQLRASGNQNLKPKNLVGIPWRVALALQAEEWFLRGDIIWNKPNCMPESVKDRPTKCHEYLFLLSKNEKYNYNFEAIKEKCVNGDPNPPRGSLGVIGQGNSGRRDKGNRKTFRGGGVYTKNQSFNNSAEVANSSHGNIPNKLGLRNKRSVWTIATQPCKEAHFATFPEKLIEPCIKAGCHPEGIVLDPFIGAGTTGIVAQNLGRNFIGIEL